MKTFPDPGDPHHPWFRLRRRPGAFGDRGRGIRHLKGGWALQPLLVCRAGCRDVSKASGFIGL